MLDISGLDKAVFRFINTSCAWKPIDCVMFFLSVLAFGIVFPCISLSLILYGIISKNVKFRQLGYATAISQIGAGIISGMLKEIWTRPRPLLSMHDVRIGREIFFRNGFPSGHTTAAFAFCVAVSMLFPKTRWAMIPLAFLIGISRIYLGSHYPLDVIFGAAFGSVIGAISASFFLPKEDLTKDE